ncbi:MAG: N-acetylmuramoyl-L-alanine amidase [Solirubrobacterales bacterium]
MPRRRTIIAASLALAAAGMAWVAAPALSLRPYLPPARDFGQPLPEVRALDPAERAVHTPAGGEHAGDPVRFISAQAEAPHEFDLVGLAAERREVEIRVRSADDGQWSAWEPSEGGDPIYAPGSDAAQVRARDFHPEGELHYVNVSGTGGGFGERLLSAARGGIHGAFLSAARSAPVRLLLPGTAEAARPPQPDFVSRTAWGADSATGGCHPRTSPVYGNTRAIVVHHTVSTVDYTPEQAPGIVLGICRYHLNGNGWNDIGYNALVDRFGTLYEGRAGGMALPVVGAHTEGYNSQTAGIASIGDHTLAPLTPEAQWSLVRYLAWKLTVSRVAPRGLATLYSAGGVTNRNPAGASVVVARIFGHGVTNLTECPGPLFASVIPQVRAQVRAMVKRYARGKRGRKKGRKKHRARQRTASSAPN